MPAVWAQMEAWAALPAFALVCRCFVFMPRLMLKCPVACSLRAGFGSRKWNESSSIPGECVEINGWVTLRLPEVLIRMWCKRLLWECLTQMNSRKQATQMGVVQNKPPLCYCVLNGCQSVVMLFWKNIQYIYCNGNNIKVKVNIKVKKKLLYHKYNYFQCSFQLLLFNISLVIVN